jgi:2'-5' RNA ligase
LCARIYENLSELGLTLERNDTVHLTLGRIKKPLKMSERTILEEKFELLVLNIPVGVSSVTLFESKIFREGPVYRRISKVGLGIEDVSS